MLHLPEIHDRPVRAVQADISAELQRLRDSGRVCLNLGCGAHPIAGVTNCDLHSDLADLNVDLTSIPQHGDGTVDLIETHHAIEHLALADVPAALTEWARLLRKGGCLVITCPDLDAVVRQWQQSDRSLDSYELKMLFGSQEHPGMFHKSGFCRKSLSSLLELHGFRTLFTFTPYPDRQTPSLLVIAERTE